MKEKTILFKIWKFPVLSETFILSQIITAIKCGYNVKILIVDLMDIRQSTHGILIGKYNLLDKIIYEDYRVPNNRFLRYIKAVYLIIINLKNINKLWAFVLNKNKRSINDIFIFNFFKNFNKYGIIHVQYGTNGRPLDRLKKVGLISSKLIVSFHGHDLFFPINGIIPNNGYYDNLFRYADLLVANTPYLESLLLKYGAPPEKIKTIPVAINTNFFEPNRLEKKNTDIINIITVGRLEVFKGQRLGIECIKQLIEKGYNIQYTIVGTGSQETILKELVKQYNLNNKVQFVGRKSQASIKELLQQHDLFLMTSITDPAYGAETQGLVTAEAQACGLPVVAFDSGGVKYTVSEGETGFVVLEGHIEAMRKKVEKLINNEELRLKMGKAAINFVEKNFSQNEVNKIWCNTYDNLLEKE